MAEGDDSPDASQAFLSLFSSYVAIKPEGEAEQANLSLPSQLLLSAMDKRVSRINGSSETLTPIIWRSPSSAPPSRSPSTGSSAAARCSRSW